MLLIFISYFIIYKVFTSYVGNFWKEANSVFLSNLEIASLVKGTDLDYGYGIISIFFFFRTTKKAYTAQD